MNPELPKDERTALESSLTALLLGELTHEQAAALHQKLAQDAELAKLYERLKHTINLVRETVASPAAQTADHPTPLKLSDQRRQKLLQHFKTLRQRNSSAPRRRADAVACPGGDCRRTGGDNRFDWYAQIHKSNEVYGRFGLGPYARCQ